MKFGNDLTPWRLTLLMALFDYVCLFETRLVLRSMYHSAQHLSVGMRARTRTGTSLLPSPPSYRTTCTSPAGKVLRARVHAHSTSVI